MLASNNIFKQKKHVIEIAQKFLWTENLFQRNMDPDLLDLPILL